MNDNLMYHERLSSSRTQALFVALAIVFFLLSIWRAQVGGIGALAVVLFGIGCVFVFYTLNFRTLIIRLTPEHLMLRFGIFKWIVPWENVEACRLDDDIPWVMRMGGAGVHFMFVHKRYRASFNFLEYPRVAISFKWKVGPVQDISFSTCQPDEVLRLIQQEVDARRAA